MAEELIVNKVAESGLITLDLANYLPSKEIKSFDLKDFLFMGLILKEKDFRQALTTHDWLQYQDAPVAVFCSADAIVPNWAYMLVASYLGGIASFVYAGSKEETEKALTIHNIHSIPSAEYEGKRLVIKGCGDQSIEAFAYLEITSHLKPVAKSIMYGEPCSTVPVFKSKK